MVETDQEGKRIPRIARSALGALRDRAHAREVLAAYYEPEIRYSSAEADDREIRVRGAVRLVVAGEVIISVREHQPPPNDHGSRLGTDPRPRIRRGRGGSGTRLPTSVRELLKRAEAAGAVIENRHRHYVVVIPETNRRVPVPAVVGDWRALRNAAHTLIRNGLDVTRGR